ncbi:tRNA (adenosine(37)-N6)-threonylcarbamoyltransferase complex dimerization subunit type 1 TsaB [Cognatishimia sp. MH4019]|uniref:tRNA (adenosine(37)-N6)-threonylcarbamoyltransferase complex dimerization subunit type 1 TsaB n=1 Tax=Cognatishimia sp. MH4019 TaxID=2854030 RepID=UPI001CD19A4C|nr:tRNA (adenosine(37)-N6)-threonylcarbamoyltransferase complex dimerization subunit type 1 TsaB [Cognatishimia sp. MH4019]
MILAFDTSAAHCTAALLSGGKVLAHAHEDMAKGQAERLMVLLQEVLSEAGATYADLTAIAVGTGPGNFTGIRISVSAARGLALGLGIPAIGVSTLEAQAFDTPGPVLSTVDARRDQVYLQGFGYPDAPPPQQRALDTIAGLASPPGLTVIGGRSDAVSRQLDARATASAYPLAEALALVAATRLSEPQPRPKPLYIRPADAAPPRDPAPVILS